MSIIIWNTPTTHDAHYWTLTNCFISRAKTERWQVILIVNKFRGFMRPTGIAVYNQFSPVIMDENISWKIHTDAVANKILISANHSTNMIHILVFVWHSNLKRHVANTCALEFNILYLCISIPTQASHHDQCSRQHRQLNAKDHNRYPPLKD